MTYPFYVEPLDEGPQGNQGATSGCREYAFAAVLLTSALVALLSAVAWKLNASMIESRQLKVKLRDLETELEEKKGTKRPSSEVNSGQAIGQGVEEAEFTDASAELVQANADANVEHTDKQAQEATSAMLSTPTDPDAPARPTTPDGAEQPVPFANPSQPSSPFVTKELVFPAKRKDSPSPAIPEEPVGPVEPPTPADSGELGIYEEKVNGVLNSFGRRSSGKLKSPSKVVMKLEEWKDKMRRAVSVN